MAPWGWRAAAHGDSSEFRAALPFAASTSTTAPESRRRSPSGASIRSVVAGVILSVHTRSRPSKLSGVIRGVRVVARTCRHASLSSASCPRTTTGIEPDKREHIWLFSEWRDDEPEPSRFHLTNVSPDLPGKYIINLLKQRWRTERVYQDMKGDLGLDHFEGRLFRGWHHHVSFALCCYAFVTAERARRFPHRGTKGSSNRCDRMRGLS